MSGVITERRFRGPITPSDLLHPPGQPMAVVWTIEIWAGSDLILLGSAAVHDDYSFPEGNDKRTYLTLLHVWGVGSCPPCHVLNLSLLADSLSRPTYGEYASGPGRDLLGALRHVADLSTVLRWVVS